MKLHVIAFAAFVGVSLLGCGGSSVAEEAGSLEEVSQALCNVSVACPYGWAPVSCAGISCSGQDGSHVTCDGNTTYCQPPPCTASSSCEEVNGSQCFSGQRKECCWDNGDPGDCFCMSNRTMSCSV